MPTLPSDLMRSLSALLVPLVVVVSNTRSVGIVFSATVPFTVALI